MRRKKEQTKEKGKTKKDYLNRKVVHRVLSALQQVDLSDVDTDSEDDTPRGKKKLIGLCLMACSRSCTDNEDPSSDNYNEVEPSYDDLAKAVAKLGTLLDKKDKKSKKHDILIEFLNTEIARLKL